MKKKKKLICVSLMIMVFSALVSCGKNGKTYTYKNEAIHNVQIEKTEVYTDKLVITFSENSISGVEKIEYYNSDFKKIDEKPVFSFTEDTLIVVTNNANRVSGINVWESDSDLYFYVRYIDSKSYAMLTYSWSDDEGYIVNGDEETYYTQDEKDILKERAEINAEAEAFAYSTLYGKWINESENVCIVFDYDNQYIKHFSVYKLIDEEWKEYETMGIRKLDEQGSNERDVMFTYDKPYAGGRCVEFYIEPLEHLMTCEYSEEKFKRISFR